MRNIAELTLVFSDSLNNATTIKVAGMREARAHLAGLDISKVAIALYAIWDGFAWRTSTLVVSGQAV